MCRVAIALVALVLLTTAAAAQDIMFDEQLRRVKAVRVDVQSNVSDVCLPQPNALRTEAELILRRSNITVVETNDQYPHYLAINVMGRTQKSETCAVALIISVQRVEKMADNSVGMVQAFVIMRFVSGWKKKFAQKLHESVNEYTSLIANEILKARQPKPANAHKPSSEKGPGKVCGTTFTGVRWCLDQ
jgi:hypothetical protein